jgi:hypothetical protein
MAHKSKRIPYRTECEKHELIAQLMAEGYAPSVIDEELRLDKGYTREWCKLVWSKNKCRVFTKAEKMMQSEKAKRRPYTSTQNRNQEIHRKAKQQNSVVAKRYAGRNLERRNVWNK